MNLQEQNFLNILRNIINEIRNRKNEECLLELPDWDGIFTLAQSHNILPLVYSYASENGLYQDANGSDAWCISSAKQVSNQMNRTYSFLRLYSALTASGITPIVIKGIVCRELYGEHANERPSGDEDLLIRKKDFTFLRTAMEECGFVCGMDKITNQQLEELQEIDFNGYGLHVEAHVNAISKINPMREKLNQYLNNESIIQRAVDFPVNDEEGNVVILKTMCPTDHLSYLVLHGWKHFTACGLGIRQVMDILLFRDLNINQVNQEEFEAVLKGSGTLQFYNDLLSIGRDYLGFEQQEIDEGEPDVAKQAIRREILLKDILTCGCFGIGTPAQLLANSYTNAALTNGSRKNNLWRTLFPGIKQMQERFPNLINRPYLLPFYWVYRIILFIRKHKSAGKLAQESVQISQQRLKLLSLYGVVE